MLLSFATELELCNYMIIPAFIKANSPMKQKQPYPFVPPPRLLSNTATAAWSWRWQEEALRCSP